MGWRFRKSFSPIPGVRINLSPSGISTSIGVGPLHFNAGARGAAFGANVPGTGLSFRQPLGNASPERSDPRAWNSSPTAVPPAPLPPVLPDLPMHEIRSAESSVLTSPGLAAFRQALDQAERQYVEIDSDLGRARAAESEAVDHHRQWMNGWFFKRVLKQRFAEMGQRAAEATDLRSELEEQLKLSRLPTQFEMTDAMARAYEDARESFAALARSQRIWDNVAHRAANKVVERTMASRVVDLKPVRFSLAKSAVIDAPMTVPKMENANGGDLFFYPGFLVYHAAAHNYALVEYGDLEVGVRRTQFQDESSLPTDAKQVGTTWAKANKDGSPDMRFKENYPIPVMQYATLVIRTPAGLNEEYMVSNVEAAEAFLEAWRTMCASRV